MSDRLVGLCGNSQISYFLVIRGDWDRKSNIRSWFLETLICLQFFGSGIF